MPDGSYSVSDIQDCFEFISEKHGEDIDEPSVEIYVNKIKNSITFNLKMDIWTFNTRDNEGTWEY